MADDYIDQWETVTYGQFAREQLAEVCLGRVPDLDGMVHYAIACQEAADADIQAVLTAHTVPAVVLDARAVLAETRDVVGRFFSHLDSIKGHPIDPRALTRGDVPSTFLRRRMTKLASGVKKLVEEYEAVLANDVDAERWLAELVVVRDRLAELDRQQRAGRLKRVDEGPEVAAARERWLKTYSANKLLIRGLLAHLEKPELLPLIFDDLAEVHRASGVSDEEPEPTEPTPTE